MRLLERRFTVNVPPERAWSHLVRVEAWPSWARHIRRVDASPPGPLGPGSSGTIRLANGIRSTFRMESFEPGRRWLWSGPFLWLTVRYDHRFEARSDGATELVFTVEGEGFGAGSLGRLFAAVYARNLDRAIPRLVAELEAAEDGSGA